MPLTLFAPTIMPFPFSFRFTVPGIPNPFLAPTSVPPRSRTSTSESTRVRGLTGSRIGPGESGRHSPSLLLAPPRPLAKKRGWVPSESELSRAMAVSASTSGYLDTPAKYRDIAPSHNSQEDDIEEMEADLPAPKRRRTLAGSIVSTALSAALIGTAVGLTVYRLWRDRGKHPEPLPPPPYEEGGWSAPVEQASTSAPATKVTPPTPRSKKHRHVAGRRTLPRHRKAPSRAQAYTPPRSASPVQEQSLPIEYSPEVPEPTLDEPEEAVEVEEQMDWMSDRLARLIEEGKRALGTEVVVMSESQEDAIDDGSGDWVEDDAHLPASISRSFRKSKTKSRNPLPSSSPPSYSSPQTSPRKDRFAIPSIQSRNRGLSIDSERSFVSSVHEHEAAWETPELRESMERARAMYRERHRMS